MFEFMKSLISNQGGLSGFERRKPFEGASKLLPTDDSMEKVRNYL
jgi:hypothetical protein